MSPTSCPKPTSVSTNWQTRIVPPITAHKTKKGVMTELREGEKRCVGSNSLRHLDSCPETRAVNANRGKAGIFNRKWQLWASYSGKNLVDFPLHLAENRLILGSG